MSVAETLQKLGIDLPDPPKPVGAYEPWVRSGNLIITAGQLPWKDKLMLWPGRLGDQVNIEEGYWAARQAGVNVLAQLHAASGSLENVRILRLEGYVHCASGFRDHPKVLDGASDLFLSVLGERGRHVRTALGIPDMPLNACVQLSVWAEIL